MIDTRRTESIRQQWSHTSPVTHPAYEAMLEHAEKLERELAAERALADRLAEILEDIRHFYGIAECAKQPVTEALAAWKEARHEP